MKQLALVALCSCLLLKGCVGEVRDDGESVGTVIANPDPFERRTSASGVRVLAGHTATSEWRLYAWSTGKKKTCLGFYEVATAPATELSSGGAWCDQKLPLGVSVVNSEHGNFIFGVVSAAAKTIRVEYLEGESESLGVSSHPGFPHPFYAGELRARQAARVLALTDDGRVLATEIPTPGSR